MKNIISQVLHSLTVCLPVSSIQAQQKEINISGNGFIVKGVLILTLIQFCLAIGFSQTDYFADNGESRAIDPMFNHTGYRYKNKTYIVYEGPSEDPYICSYDHVSGKWEGPVKVGTSLLPDDDDHGTPAVVVDDRGYIHVVFGGHGGDPKYADPGDPEYWGPNAYGNAVLGRQTHMVSDDPEDITDWTDADDVPPYGTYSHWVKMDDGDIYLFYRHGGHKSDWVYQRSSDDGVTFGDPVPVLEHVHINGDDEVDSWYAWFGKGLGDTIVGTFVYHKERFLSAPTIHDDFNCYFMQMDASDHTWKNVSGSSLTIPIPSVSYANSNCLVVDTATGVNRRGVVRVDSSGKPHVLMRKGGVSQLQYSRWTGTAWTSIVKISDESTGQNGDLLVYDSNNVDVLLTGTTHKTIAGFGGDVVWWITDDGGASWTKDPANIIDASADKWRVSCFVENGIDNAVILANENEIHLYDDFGFVSRFSGSGNGITSYWKMDQNGNDSSGNGNNGTLGGDAGYVSGHIGHALDLDGDNDYFNVPDSDLTSNWSITFWAKVENTVSNQAVGRRADNDNFFYLRHGTRARFENSAGENVDWTADTDFQNKWRHVALVAGMSTIRLYLDGVDQGSKTITPSFRFHDVGKAYNSNNDHDFQGQIDDVRFFNQPIREETVFLIYELGVQAWWKFDENASDSSGNGNHGTLGGTATYAVGQVDYGLECDGGNDYVDIPNTDLSSNWTICFWAKVDTADHNMAIGNRADDDNFFYLADGTRARFENSAGANVDWTTDTDFQSRWRHVALVAETSTVRLYLDGVDQGSRTITPSFKFYDIGKAYSLNNDHDYDGTIDDVRYFDQPLAQEAIYYIQKQRE